MTSSSEDGVTSSYLAVSPGGDLGTQGPSLQPYSAVSPATLWSGRVPEKVLRGLRGPLASRKGRYGMYASLAFRDNRVVREDTRERTRRDSAERGVMALRKPPMTQLTETDQVTPVLADSSAC